jgi:hypothetical protein
MKKGLFCVFICMLMLVGALLPIIAASHERNAQTNDFETVRHGFFIGYFNSIEWEGDRCILTMDRLIPGPYPVTYIVPFRFLQLAAFQQIQLINPTYCIIHDNFIIGFCSMLFPKSTVSMHVISQVDEFNTVRWVIDDIEGDAIWGSNLRPRLYHQDGSKYTGGFFPGPYPWKPAYLSVGDEFQIIANEDGMYQMKLFDDITGRVVYSSPYIHF